MGSVRTLEHDVEATDRADLGLPVDREHASDVERDFFRNARPTSLLQRFEEPEEIAAFVAFVASPLASGINGASLRVDGGVVRSIA